MPIYTSHQSKISLIIAGVALDNQSWDRFQGGGHQSETQNYPPGGMQPSVATGGVTKRNQATLERAWDDTLIGLLVQLDGSVNAPCLVGVTPLKNASTAAGKARGYSGVIREVNPPDQDSTSSSIAMLQVVIELNEAMVG